MFENYKNQIDVDITTKTTANSIEPVVVGRGYTDLVDLLAPYLEKSNNQAYFEGTGDPNNTLGADLDLYAKLQNPVVIYRKESGAWVKKWTIPLGFTFSDGLLIGVRASLLNGLVTVTSGQWAVSGTLYSKITQTEFTLAAAHATLQRNDLIYASNSNDSIFFLAGTPGLGTPATPANSIIVDIAISPPVSSGNTPYLVYGNTLGAVAQLTKTKITGTQATVSGPGYVNVPIDSTHVWGASYVQGGVTYWIGQSMLQAGAIYGFPDAGNFTYTINYI